MFIQEMKQLLFMHGNIKFVIRQQTQQIKDI